MIIFAVIIALINLIVFSVFSPLSLETANLKLVFWFSYAFMMIAFGMQVLALLMGRFRDGIEAAFFGFPLISVSIFYFAITTVLSLMFMILVSFSVEVPLILVIVLEVILLGVFIIAFVVSLAHRDAVSEIDQNIKKNVRTIRNLTGDVESLAEAIEDREMKKALSALAEDFRYSDPMTTDAVADLDLQMKDAVAELELLVSEGDLTALAAKVRETKLLIAKRNRRLADSK